MEKEAKLRALDEKGRDVVLLKKEGEAIVLGEEPVETKGQSTKYEIVNTKYSDLTKKSVFKNLLMEGETLDGKNFSERVGLRTFLIYSYTLSNLEKTAKVKFAHALFGRGRAGLLSEVKGETLGRGVLMVPVDKEKDIDDFFSTWRVAVSKTRVLRE